jgi:hypothetical protein
MSPSTDQIQRVADELAIRDLIARFADGCSPPNYEAVRKLWTPDPNNQPVWSLSEPFKMESTGVDNIIEMHRKLLEIWDMFVQLVHSGVVDIDGDKATGRWILREVAKGPNETYYNNFAIYDDKYEKFEGKWYIARRDYTYMFLDSGPFPGNVCKPIEDWFKVK